MIADQLARFGEAHALHAADDELRAEARFQLIKPAAYRGLSEAEQFRGAAEAACLRHGEKDAQIRPVDALAAAQKGLSSAYRGHT